MQQARHMVVVVPNPKSLRDEVSDHGAGPDPARISSLDGPLLNERGELVALGLAEPRRRPRRPPREQAGDAQGLVPAQPSVDGAARDIEFRRNLKGPPALDVSEDGAGPTPDIEVVALQGHAEQPPQLLPT